MSVSQPSLTMQTVAAAKSRALIEPLLGLFTGVLGGAIQSKILSAPMSQGILLGGIGAGRRVASLVCDAYWNRCIAPPFRFFHRHAERRASAVSPACRLLGFAWACREVLSSESAEVSAPRKDSRNFAGAVRSWLEDLPAPSVDWPSAAGNMQEGTCRCSGGCRTSNLRLGR
jgi:hypothetical protein